MSLQSISRYPRVVYHARRSTELGKLAAATEIPARAARLLEEKVAADAALFNELEKMGSGLLRGLRLAKAEGLGKALVPAAAAGAGGATGAALAMGSGVEDVREDLGSAATSALGIAASIYALKKLHDSQKEDGDDGEDATSEKESAALATPAKIAAAAQVAIQTRSVISGMVSPSDASYAAKVASTAMAHVADMVSGIVLE
jgi:hypothetical protein